MSDQERLIATLTRPKSIRFRNNEAEVSAIKDQLSSLKTQNVNGSTFWFVNDQPSVANTRVKTYPTGHMVFYNSEGRRILFADPEGHPLHECEWKKDEVTGKTKLAYARMQLDYQQWFGIQPDVKTFSVNLNLMDFPGSASLTLDDLRRKIATAWDIPFSEVEHFYRDENFVRLGLAEYEIHLTKDGLYVLLDGTFERTLFISYMPRVEWAELDVLPVVELYQSAPPGAGGAAFELFWGLYEDQSRENKPEPLRFRGLPVYPSKKAFEIFSAYFSPTVPEDEDLMEMFMDYKRAYQIEWDLRPDPPWRYFTEKHSACLTVQDHFLYKVTLLNDPVGLPFINCSRGAKTSCQREIWVTENVVTLIDADEVCREIPLLPLWQIFPQPKVQAASPYYPFGWKEVFKGRPPKTDPVKAVLALPFYPEHASEIEESSLQPMVVDQIIFYMENYSDMPSRLEKIDRVLVHNFDMASSGCIDATHERDYRVLFNNPEFAQKNAQLLWEYASARNQLHALTRVSFLPEKKSARSAYREKYGMIFRWIPFKDYTDLGVCEKILKSVAYALDSNGFLFLVGPGKIGEFLEHHSLSCIYSDAVKDMPFFLQHQKMYPETQVNPDVTVFFAEKHGEADFPGEYQHGCDRR